MAFCSSVKRNQQSTPNAESHSSRRLVVSPVSNRSSPPQRLSVRRTNFRGPIANRQFSTDTPKIAAPTLGVSAEHPSQSSQPQGFPWTLFRQCKQLSINSASVTAIFVASINTTTGKALRSQLLVASKMPAEVPQHLRMAVGFQ